MIQEINAWYHNHNCKDKLFYVVAYNLVVINYLEKYSSKEVVKFQKRTYDDVPNLALSRLENIDVDAQASFDIWTYDKKLANTRNTKK